MFLCYVSQGKRNIQDTCGFENSGGAKFGRKNKLIFQACTNLLQAGVPICS